MTQHSADKHRPAATQPLQLLAPVSGPSLKMAGILLPTLRVSLEGADVGRRSTHGAKTEVRWHGDQLFAEEVVVTVLRETGWSAFWVDGWKGRYWPEVAWPDPNLLAWLATVKAELRHDRGVWDVVAAKGDQVVAYELKGPGDRVRPEQVSWYAIARRHGLDPTVSAVLTWTPS